MLRLTALLVIIPAISLAQHVAIGAYVIPTVTSAPASITAGPDGALWFTEFSGNKIGRITTGGTLTEYPVPTTHSGLYGIATGSDGALWFTEETASKIGRITTAGTITEYLLPAFSYPVGITAGPDGALWFAEYSSQIGTITTAGVITHYTTPTLSSGPEIITAGPDGALWFTEYVANQIGRVTTAGVFTEYPIPTVGGGPFGITAGPDGALWFTENLPDIGRITTAGVITEYPTPGNCQPKGITTGPDGALWYANYCAHSLGRITTSGTVSSYKLGGGYAPEGLTTGPDHQLWFTEYAGSRIGEAVFQTAYLRASPDAGPYQTPLTFTGEKFAPNEPVNVYLAGIGSLVLASATADSTGSFTVPAVEPISPNGSRLFLAMGQNSGRVGAASFSVTASVVLSPNAGPVGASVVAQGYGFSPWESLTISWKKPKTTLGTVVTDVNGTFNGTLSVSFNVPAGAAIGTNTVNATPGANGVKASTTFTVQ